MRTAGVGLLALLAGAIAWAQLQAPGAVSVTVAPDAPAGLQVVGDVAGNQHVYLYWQGGPEVVNAPPPALTVVNLYRSEVAGGPYALVKASPITDPAGIIVFEDFPHPANTYYYVMSETDAAGAETDFSPEMQAVVP